MRRIFFLLLATTTALFGQSVQIPPVARHTLPNGLTIMLVEYKKLPLVHFRLVARGGSAMDPEGQEGIATMATSLMREGTSTRSSPEIAQAIDFIGGSLSAAAGLDYCAVNAEVLNKDIDMGLALFADIILHPVFPKEEIERERKQRLANLEALKEEPPSIASVVFNRLVYAPHPYGKQSFGTKSSIAALTREQLVEFHRNIFAPNNSILVVVGDISEHDMLSKLTKAFDDWGRETEQEISLPAPVRLQGRKVILVNKPDATQTQIRVGNIGVDIKHPDRFAIVVANTILGGGFTSRLNNELRVRRSLTYGVDSRFPANLAGGTYAIYTFTKNETVSDLIDALLGELHKFRDKGVTSEELHKAQNYVAGSFARSLQAPEALAAKLTDIELYGLPKDYLETYIRKLKTVKLEDVLRVAQQHFLLDDLLIVLVTPAQTTKPAVERYGDVSVVELKDALQ
jgi:zinc protease